MDTVMIDWSYYLSLLVALSFALDSAFQLKPRINGE